jgi:hypothetical protein
MPRSGTTQLRGFTGEAMQTMNTRKTYLAAGWGVVGMTVFMLSYISFKGRNHPGLSQQWMWPFIIGCGVLLVVLVAYQIASRRRPL